MYHTTILSHSGHTLNSKKNMSRQMAKARYSFCLKSLSYTMYTRKPSLVANWYSSAVIETNFGRLRASSLLRSL